MAAVAARLAGEDPLIVATALGKLDDADSEVRTATWAWSR